MKWKPARTSNSSQSCKRARKHLMTRRENSKMLWRLQQLAVRMRTLLRWTELAWWRRLLAREVPCGGSKPWVQQCRGPNQSIESWGRVGWPLGFIIWSTWRATCWWPLKTLKKMSLSMTLKPNGLVILFLLFFCINFTKCCNRVLCHDNVWLFVARI